MRIEEAIELIRPAVPAGRGGRWADLGAGGGTFTRALARLLGPGGRVLAVDRDPDAVAAVRDHAAASQEPAAIEAAEGDLRRLDAVPGLADAPLDGVLFANALHFLPDPAPVLRQAAALLRPGGRIVVVEYDGRRPNRWVPHLLPRERLRELAPAAGLAPPTLAGERRSAYGGVLYCAALVRPG